tara:strand:+ start:2815 stop:3471 length:657 start_codon:yes stop_codon:yes gene_type:complete
MYKVTVGISCYKQKEWLYRCLRSLASQTFSHDDFEVVIVNDDPGISLRDVCELMSDVLNIKLLENDKNMGLPHSLNKILKHARGQYFVRVDSDDYVSEHFLYMLHTFISMNKSYHAVCCDYKKVDKVGQTIDFFSNRIDPIACGTMFTYEALCDIGFYDENFKMREGHDLIKRFKQKYELAYLEVPLYRYRIHGNNRTDNLEQIKKYDKKLNMSEENE